MPSYPAINDREFNLLKKIAENTADIAAGGGGGGGGAVNSVFGRSGNVSAQNGDYTKAQVGLGNVDNTSDANKPVSTAQQTALNLKQDYPPVIVEITDARPTPVTLTTSELSVLYSRDDQEPVIVPVPSRNGITLLFFNEGRDDQDNPIETLIQSGDDEDLFYFNGSETSNVTVPPSASMTFRSNAGLWYLVSSTAAPPDDIYANSIYAGSNFGVGSSPAGLSIGSIQAEIFSPDFGEVAAGASVDVALATNLSPAAEPWLSLNAALEAGILLQVFNPADGNIILRATNVTGSPITPAVIAHRVFAMEEYIP